MANSLFTDEKPKPYGEYPPNDAYYAILLLGLIPFACFILAPAFAYKYPSMSWRWGVWAAAPWFIFAVIGEMLRSGFPVGLLSTLANPVLWFFVALCCLLARVGKQVGMSRKAAK